MTRPKKLGDDEIGRRLEGNAHWKLHDGALCRDLRFPDFTRAFGFMASVALVAEKLDHHPDWTNVYNRVSVRLSTHDAGGVTDLDFELARAIDGLAG